jgi:hypothetical protein
MSLRSQIQKKGDYPFGLNPTKRMALKIDNHTVILTVYESLSDIDIYLGGVKRWCIHCSIHKDNNKIKQEGFLVKIRYDMLCSVEEKIQSGGDITKLLKLLIQYIYDTYPDVKFLSFNDLSRRRCDNDSTVNLAVMTYLYSEKTWYEKNFDASIAQQSYHVFDDIIKKWNKSKIETPWHVVKSLIYNYNSIPFTEQELETLYDYKDLSVTKTRDEIKISSWKDFFKPIFTKIGIAQFCIFISPWLDKFIIQYFNNLMGLTYQMPIKETGLKYTINPFIGGRYKSFFKGARKNKTMKQFVEME